MLVTSPREIVETVRDMSANTTMSLFIDNPYKGTYNLFFSDTYQTTIDRVEKAFCYVCEVTHGMTVDDVNNLIVDKMRQFNG